MILIFGGTTEGKIALAVCDQAGKNFFYSTKGDIQTIDSANANRINGSMDYDQIIAFCKSHFIKLIINAAHPFAENLHFNISEVSKALNIPVVRLERKYPNANKNAHWFNSYNDAVNYLLNNKINNLLALTGVNTIAKLKSYWTKYNCWFRILDREESRKIVLREKFPFEKILYYHNDNNELALFKELNPEAIITKESGESGGFEAKKWAANQLNIPFLVVKRPQLSSAFISVYGEYGLRKTIEKLVPEFFDLKTGYTTGTCATAATKAALSTLLSGFEYDEIGISLPNSEWIKIPIHTTQRDQKSISCSIIKDSGDDPDITNGHLIVSTVQLNLKHKGVRFLQGKGVGRVTLPGLGISIGEPAINKTPRMMMKRELFKVMKHYEDQLPLGLKTGIDVTISVPDGEQLAAKTFNPKLGIEGGISIIGTSGIIKPYSSEAFINSICREMEVAKALGCRHIVINSGAKSEKYVKQLYPDLSAQSFIHYGNFIGDTIKIAFDLGIEKLTMGIMLGKAVKLAEGSLDTHSKKVVMNKDFLCKTAEEAGCSQKTIEAIKKINMARLLWEIIPANEKNFFTVILQKSLKVCLPLFPIGKLEILLIDEEGRIVQ